VSSSDTSVNKFVDVLEALQDYKSDYLNAMADSKLPIVTKSIPLIKRFLQELGNIPTASYMELRVYECLLLNSSKIYRLKGTEIGLVQLFGCIAQTVLVSIDSSNLFPDQDYYSLDDAKFSELLLSNYGQESLTLNPDGSIRDLSQTNPYDDASNNITDFNRFPDVYNAHPNDNFLYLFDDLSHGVENSITITITNSPYYNNLSSRDIFKAYVLNLIPYFFPNVTNRTTITINYN